MLKFRCDIHDDVSTPITQCLSFCGVLEAIARGGATGNARSIGPCFPTWGSSLAVALWLGDISAAGWGLGNLAMLPQVLSMMGFVCTAVYEHI